MEIEETGAEDDLPEVGQEYFFIRIMMPKTVKKFKIS